MKRTRLLIFFAAVLGLLFSVSAFAEAAYDGYIVRFKNVQNAAYAQEMLDSAVLFSEDGESVSAELEPMAGDGTLFTVESAALVDMLEQAGLIEYSEPDYYLELYSYDYDADPQFSNQWAHTATKIAEAWSLGIYGNDATVAVLDSGIYEHTDLAENLLPGVNFVPPLDADGNPTGEPLDKTDMTDTVGHGTSVAGIICAAANGKGVVGAAHRAKVLPLKVAATSTFKASYVANAIMTAISRGVDVISMSFGFYSDGDALSTTLYDAVELALDFNIIVVAAAGNDGQNSKGSKYSYPASYDGVISVANLMRSGGGYTCSPSSQHNDKVTIIAPGTSVYSTRTNGSYSAVSGTSFSAPYIAAVAALAKSVDKNITPAHFRELLIATADKSLLNGAERSDYYGYGLVNAGALLRALAKEQSFEVNGTIGFISPVDLRTDGGATVTFSNLSEASGKESGFSLIAGLFSGKRPLSFRVLAGALTSGGSEELDLTGMTEGSGVLRCYLLDSAGRPVSKVREKSLSA